MSRRPALCGLFAFGVRREAMRALVGGG
jgi:hypothetical protein